MNTSLLNLPKCIIIYLTSFLKICDKAKLKQICKRYNECITFSPIEIIHKYEGYISKLKNMKYEECVQCKHMFCINCIHGRYQAKQECSSCNKFICRECFNEECGRCYNVICNNCLPKYKCNKCNSYYCLQCDTIQDTEQCTKCDNKYCHDSLQCDTENTLECSCCVTKCCPCNEFKCNGCDDIFCESHIETYTKIYNKLNDKCDGCNLRDEF